MGVFKSHLLVGHTPLYKVLERNLEPLHIPTFIISKEHLNEPNAITDIYPDDTPLAGVVTALSTVRASRVLFVPVDMPLVSADILSPLFAVSQTNASVFFTLNGFLQPFPSLISRSALPQLMHSLNEGCYKLTEVFSSLSPVVLPYEGDLDLLLNVNTWQDWEVFRSLCIKNA